MSGCLLAGALTLALSGPGFTLEWTHSVERTGWREAWAIRDGALVLTEAAVKGSGAGMDPGPGAVLRNGWWVWRPDLPPQPQLLIAASGATGGGWRLCDMTPALTTDARNCTELGVAADQPQRLSPCPPGRIAG
ncbi:DUF1850 domain-containing protein [Paracoccus sp. M683]|uniref:DUF1850 domain-containing protein n=1 Tax=Paracoccus sp. M683 TaxID=2594268 RepID=UPI00117C098D|nr:DUF1850 domain-containing protein [Paracoccus sp. M683]TRW96204.1 DUF1850 domain-containing protein [Paracoccus sp. M683]